MASNDHLITYMNMCGGARICRCVVGCGAMITHCVQRDTWEVSREIK